MKRPEASKALKLCIMQHPLCLAPGRRMTHKPRGSLVCCELTDKAATILGTGRSVFSGSGDAGSTPVQTTNPPIESSLQRFEPLERSPEGLLA